MILVMVNVNLIDIGVQDNTAVLGVLRLWQLTQYTLVTTRQTQMMDRYLTI